MAVFNFQFSIRLELSLDTIYLAIQCDTQVAQALQALFGNAGAALDPRAEVGGGDAEVVGFEAVVVPSDELLLWGIHLKVVDDGVHAHKVVAYGGDVARLAGYPLGIAQIVAVLIAEEGEVLVAGLAVEEGGLLEIGLTNPSRGGTCGHRGVIFLYHYGWVYRITFLSVTFTSMFCIIKPYLTLIFSILMAS